MESPKRPEYPKVLPSSVGEIERLLVVYNPSLDGGFGTFPERLKPLLEAIMVEKDHCNVLLDILVAKDFDLKETFERSQEEDQTVDKEERNKNLGKLFFENYYSYIFPRSISGYPRTTFRISYTNLDFKQILEEVAYMLQKVVEIKKIKDTIELTNWIQDPFVVLESEGKDVILLESFYTWDEKLADESAFVSRFIAEMLSSQSDILQKSTPFFLHGGNILVGSSYAIIGVEIIHRNYDGFGGDFSTGNVYQFMATLANALGVKKVICFDAVEKDNFDREIQGDFFHVDLFLTLGGKQDDDSELIFVGKLYRWTPKGWKALNKKNSSPEDLKKVKYLNAYVGRIKKGNSKASNIKFKIVRVPIALYNDTIFSYNNCLVEISPMIGKRVILPVYFSRHDAEDIPEPGTNPVDFGILDRRAKKIFKNEGFKVTMLDMSFRLEANGHGALHCITQVLSRTRS